MDAVADVYATATTLGPGGTVWCSEPGENTCGELNGAGRDGIHRIVLR